MRLLLAESCLESVAQHNPSKSLYMQIGERNGLQPLGLARGRDAFVSRLGRVVRREIYAYLTR